jgi:hypothetical protein
VRFKPFDLLVISCFFLVFLFPLVVVVESYL